MTEDELDRLEVVSGLLFSKVEARGVARVEGMFAPVKGGLELLACSEAIMAFSFGAEVEVKVGEAKRGVTWRDGGCWSAVGVGRAGDANKLDIGSMSGDKEGGGAEHAVDDVKEEIGVKKLHGLEDEGVDVGVIGLRLTAVRGTRPECDEVSGEGVLKTSHVGVGRVGVECEGVSRAVHVGRRRRQEMMEDRGMDVRGYWLRLLWSGKVDRRGEMKEWRDGECGG